MSTAASFEGNRLRRRGSSATSPRAAVATEVCPHYRTDSSATLKTDVQQGNDLFDLRSWISRNKHFVVAAVLIFVISVLVGCTKESPSTKPSRPVQPTQPSTVPNPQPAPNPQPSTAPKPPSPSPPISPTPPSLFGVIDHLVASLQWGNIVFTAPESIPYREAQRVELLVSPSQSIAELTAQLRTRAKVPIESDRVQVSNVMEATLTGSPGLTIQPAGGNSVRAVPSEGTNWVWIVTPTEYDNPQVLDLILFAYIKVEANDRPYVVETFHRTIKVQITLREKVAAFVGHNYQWLWTVLIVPFAGYLWRLRRR